MHKLWEHRWLILSLLVAILAGRMLLSTHHFYVHDDIQVFRLNEFVECLKTGQIPCRWSSELGKGYGYPWFNFYPPMIYLISSGFHLLGFSLITSLNLLAFASMILAAWGMYLLVKELTENPPIAFFGSLLLTLYPFHATNIFLRGVYAENLAWSLTPWLWLYLTRQLKFQKTQAILPFLFALLYLTHIISSFIVTGLSILFVVALHFLYQTGLRPLKKIAWQLGLAVAMAAFFLLPA